MNGFHRMLHRGQFHRKKGHKIRAAIYARIIRGIYQNDISLKADTDDDVWFCHKGFGVVINPAAIVLGGGTTVQHCVTIGELDGSGEAPHIGHNVFIGAKATILGNVNIGDNAKIGAGAVVLCDVPEGCTAVGVPARIIDKVENI